MKNETTVGDSSGDLNYNVSQKLTLDDIDKIEKYRQTRKTSVLTIMFTDIVGYTQFTYNAGEGASARLRHIHDEIIINHVKHTGHGEIIKQIGDSFLIVFSDPTLAVKFALKLQELFRVNAENLMFQNYLLEIRIGLHMGQVSVEEHFVSDVFGTHVNLAARVMSLAIGGQVVVSGSVWENASGWLKDDAELKAESVYYGKIKLKGIGKPTEIYEFYSKEAGKIGTPKLILKRKQKIRIMLSAIIVILLIMFSIPVIYISKNKSNDSSKKTDYRKEIIFLANIRTSFEESSYLKALQKKTGNLFLPIESDQLDKINENYYSLLKTNFIVNYEIETEFDLKRKYAKRGLTVPMGDQIIETLGESRGAYKSIAIIEPYLFKNKEDGSFFLFIDFSINDFVLPNYSDKELYYHNKASTIYDKVLTYLDSVPYFINRATLDILTIHNKSLISSGIVIKIDNEDVIIKFEVTSNMKKPIAGLSYTAHRTYKPWTNLKDSGVIQRVNDLEKVLKYYGTVEEWILNIDSSDYNIWSFSELRNLKNPNRIFGGETEYSTSIPAELKIVEVFDTTALAKIQYKEFPWVELEVGDEVRLK